MRSAWFVGKLFDLENPLLCALRDTIFLRGVFANVIPRQQRRVISYTVE